MADSVGFFSGFIEGQQASDQHSLMGLKIQEGQQTLQENDLKIQAAKRALTIQDRIMQQIGSTGSGDKPSPSTATAHAADELMRVGQIQLESGQVEASRQTFTTASSLQRNQAYIDKVNSDTQVRGLTVIHTLIDPATIHNQQEFDDAQDRIAIEIGHPSPYKGKPYSPELVTAIHNAAVSSKDTALVQERLATAKKDEAQAAEAEYRTTNLLPAQVENTKARTANLEKTGDKHLVATSTDVGRIVDLAKQDFGTDVDGSTLRAASLSVAEHAKSLIVKQHMDPDEAYKQAYTEARRNGVYGGLSMPKQIPGSSAASPRTVPKGAKATDLKPNEWYILNDGTKAVWQLDAKHPDGTVGPGFVVPGATKEGSGGGEDESDETDEDET
jgi:hypothetical protein